MSFSWVSVFSNQAETRSTFRTHVRTLVEEDTEDVMSDEQFNKIIEQGLRDINFRTGLLPEYAEVTADGSEYYTLPARITKIGTVIYKSSDGIYYPVVRSNLNAIQEKGVSNNIPSSFIREGNRLYIYGYSGVSGGTLRVYGSRLPTLPTQDTDYIDLPEDYLEALSLWCQWKFWTRRRSLDEANLSAQLYMEYVKNINQSVAAEYAHGVSFYG